MADYVLYRMRLRQENKLANLSSKIDKDRALAGYRQALQINSIQVEERLLRQDNDKLSPAMQAYYWDRVKELCDLRKKHPNFRS